jgi:hypothetical protein
MFGDGTLPDGGQLLRHSGHILGAGPVRRHRDLRMYVRAPAVALEPQGDGHQGSTGVHGQRGRSGSDPGALAEQRHLDPARAEIPIGDDAGHLPGPQAAGHDAERAGPAGVRDHFQPKALPVGHELPEQRLRPQPLGHHADPPGSAGREPGGSDIDVAHVRQREDHASSGLQLGHGRAHFAGHVHPGHDSLARRDRQPEGLHPVPQVGPHACARQLAQAGAGGVRLDPAQIDL